ncbi:MAG: GNAT family N-acetyltransferase [Burkholderiales bacterium]
MTVTFRDMQRADLDAVLALLAHWNLAPSAPSAENPHPERTEFTVENATVAVDGGRIIGVNSYIVLSPTVAEGASFAVAPAYRGRGIGKQLIDASRRKMYRRGIRTIKSEADRPEVIRMFVARGARIVGTVPKRHAFGSAEADRWTVLEVDLDTLPEFAKGGARE